MKKIITILISLAFASAGFGNLIQNGDFEAGNDGSFTSDYDYVASTGSQALWDEAKYAVGLDPYNYHYLWTSFGDHTTGDGLMMICNGQDPEGTAPQQALVWGQDVVVAPSALYDFSVWIAPSYPQAYPILEVSINGDLIGTAVAPGGTLPGDWYLFTAQWTSGAGGTVAIEIRDMLSIHTGNDFVIDDINFCAIMIPVDIDIKPGSYPNALNSDGHGIIPVAILGSADFDVTQIDVTTLSFAGLQLGVKGKDRPQCSVEDVSGDFTEGPEGAPDGYPDLVCQFVDDPDLWAPGDSMATVTGNLLDGTPFEGSDEITIVPK